MMMMMTMMMIMMMMIMMMMMMMTMMMELQVSFRILTIDIQETCGHLAECCAAPAEELQNDSSAKAI